MIKSEPQVNLSGKYELREAAKVLEISPSCLAKWTAQGKIKAGVKKVNGRKFWSGAELLRVWKATI